MVPLIPFFKKKQNKNNHGVLMPREDTPLKSMLSMGKYAK